MGLALRGKAHACAPELEDELAGLLELAGRTEVADWESRRSDYAEGGGSDGRAGPGVAEAGVIEEVEGIDAKLEENPLGDLRVLIE